MSKPLDNMTEYARGIVRELAESNTEVRRLRTELAEADKQQDETLRLVREVSQAHATMLRECQTLIAERDTLRQQLAVAREGLEFYTQHWPSVAEHARDTLAKMESPAADLIAKTRQKQDEIIARAKKEPDYER